METAKGTQKYLEIYEDFREDIIKGKYKPGEKLPSKRDVSSRYGVSVITVEHAFGLLSDEGYVFPKERSGYFCSFDTGDKYLSSVPQRETFIYIGGGSYDDYFPFGLYAKTLRRVLSDVGEGIYSKSPPQGLDRLREEISLYLSKSRRMSVTPDRVVIGSGAEYLYGLVLELVGKGIIIGLEDPSYEQIEKVYLAKGVAGCEHLKLGIHGIKTEELKKANANLLHITPYGSFPSGVSADASKRHEYIEWLEGGNRIIVEDDYGSEFTVSGKVYDSLYSMNKGKRVIYMNTFTLTLFPGLRVAYMVLPDVLIDRYKEVASFYSCTVSTLDQYVIASLFGSGEYERHINRMRRKLKEKERGN